MESDTSPLISCIMPTYNRRRFVPFAIELFLAQDYPNKELVIIDDGSDPVMSLIPELYNIHYIYIGKKRSIGTKRNIACETAKGAIIAHWDDDDWYDHRRLSMQVSAMSRKPVVELVGVANPYYIDLKTKRAFHYQQPKRGRWVTYLMYKKSLWNRIKFPNVTVGEDVRFLSSVERSRIQVMKNEEIGVCTIHRENSSPKFLGSRLWKRVPIRKIEQILNSKWPSIWN